MSFSDYLKAQLTDFVDCYKNYFWRTLGIVLTYTAICFVAMAFLLKFSNFDAAARRQWSLLSYFFSRYSSNDTYSLIDCAKSVFIFFVSLFSIGLLRLTANESKERSELSFGSFIKKLQGDSVISLLSILILCSALDYGMFRLDSISSTITNYELQKWIRSLLLQLRIYIPLILFSLTLYKLTSVIPLKINLRKIVFLLVSLWLFNEFAYEISFFVRGHIFSLMLVPFDEGNTFFYESFLGIALAAFYFVGYYSAMTTPFKLLED
jgi:hypothetical protein